MSYDLAVWRPSGQPLTAAEASRVYRDLCARPFQSLVPGAELAAFVDAVAERYRSAHAVTDRPWAAEPDVAEDYAVMPIRSDAGAEVSPIVRDLARERGLVCFDPQSATVYQHGPGDATDVSCTLELADGRTIYGPGDAVVAESIRALSDDRWYVIVERAPNVYLQAGYGGKAGAPAGHYVLEYRDGGPDEHWRAFPASGAGLAAAFSEYLHHGTAWQAAFSWAPLDVTRS